MLSIVVYCPSRAYFIVRSHRGMPFTDESLCPVLTTNENREFLSVETVTRDHKEPVAFTLIGERLAVELSIPVLMTVCLSRLGFES